VTEETLIRENLMTRPGYSPYCGDPKCSHKMPRTIFDGEQFTCKCGWRSAFPADFIARYKSTWKGKQGRMCDGSGTVWQQDFYGDGSPSRSISEWPCPGCKNCQK
jgi:hypothetical protein